ncbi:hypothetical protein [Psychrobacter sp. I-STPA10]|uniref:hypothetical protein n=1 Tax=Psychrobacter sp. I-STPA10 TaxID=2585769 RepID=UPI001E50C75F|nr:hypothetical protein [Psychrobacter sp. I-STPA10]
MINRIPKNNPYRDKENFIKESIYASLELPIDVREMLEVFKRYGNILGFCSYVTMTLGAVEYS